MIFCSTTLEKAIDIRKRCKAYWLGDYTGPMLGTFALFGIHPLCFCGLMIILCGATSLAVGITIAGFCFPVHETTECYDDFERMPFWKFSLLGLPPFLLVFGTPLCILCLAEQKRRRRVLRKRNWKGAEWCLCWVSRKETQERTPSPTPSPTPQYPNVEDGSESGREAEAASESDAAYELTDSVVGRREAPRVIRL